MRKNFCVFLGMRNRPGTSCGWGDQRFVERKSSNPQFPATNAPASPRSLIRLKELFPKAEYPVNPAYSPHTPRLLSPTRSSPFAAKERTLPLSTRSSPRIRRNPLKSPSQAFAPPPAGSTTLKSRLCKSTRRSTLRAGDCGVFRNTGMWVSLGSVRRVWWWIYWNHWSLSLEVGGPERKRFCSEYRTCLDVYRIIGA